MKSLFAKILLWFVLAIVVTAATTTVASLISYKQSLAVRAPLSILIGVGETEAEHAWLSGGREDLAATLARFREVARNASVYFTDAEGTDLATGTSRRELIEAARRHASFLFGHGRQVAFSRFSADGKYCFFFVLSPWRLLSANLQPAHLLVVFCIILVCYALADYLTSPLRSLQKAVEKFGRGDLASRAPHARRDELGELARAFNRMAEQIQTLVAAQQRLLLDISHELRSPLARLSVAIELARPGAAVEAPLNRIQREADRLNELITQMLEVARVESDPGRRTLEPVKLDELIDSLVNDCAIEAEARGCSLRLAPAGGVLVTGNRELLRRAIENVVRNAIRYAPSQSRVEVAIENGGGRARVKVRDYGPGVPEAALEHLFDPFYRVETDRDRASGGVGLGLSIARRAVEFHRGSLRASNAAPGLLVEIELPA